MKTRPITLFALMLGAAMLASATVDAGYVWTLVRDDKAGLTYVGTGSPGKPVAFKAPVNTRIAAM